MYFEFRDLFVFQTHTHLLVEALAWMNTLGSNIRRYQCYRNMCLCIHMGLILYMSQKISN